MSVGYTLHAFVERITLSPRAYMQFHSHDHQLICLCEIQKRHAARERLIGFLQIIEVDLNSTVPLLNAKPYGIA